MGESLEEILSFYGGRRTYFSQLGIPGREGHCLLLAAEALRLRGELDTVFVTLKQAAEIYRDVRMAWGIEACRLSLALYTGDDRQVSHARESARRLGLSPLAESGTATSPICLVLP